MAMWYPSCQNETLLCPWSELRYCYIVKVYILPNNGGYWLKFWNLPILSKVMPIWPLGYWKVWYGKIGSQSLEFIIGTILLIGPEVIKIKPFKLLILILNVYSAISWGNFGQQGDLGQLFNICIVSLQTISRRKCFLL